MNYDVDPHWSYADPDPQNLINMDPDPNQIRIQDNKITKVISFKSQEKNYFQICT